MSVKKVITLQCDRCHKDGPGKGSVTEQRQAARKVGWLTGSRESDRDMCKECLVIVVAEMPVPKRG
jgi:hypothetical protein